MVFKEPKAGACRQSTGTCSCANGAPRGREGMVDGAADRITCAAWDTAHPLRIAVTAADRHTVRENIFRVR